ncbi:MAG: exodeoxyribonuclease VII large subunit [Peptostreptococcaceae bacterium]|nr:exodeoxyribonuclease VII large subunit [Peptostreptococcaceae bacterium]
MANAISVSQLNGYIERVLITDPLLNNMNIKGEISGLNYHKSGHIYFSLIDAKGKVNCAIWRSNVNNIKVKLNEGDEIIVSGSINIYNKGGTYSINVRSAEVMGGGDLAKAFNDLKEKLEKLGLFDLEHKKSLPEFPKRVGVLTSATGAAIEDIKRIIKEKNNLVDILIFHTLVQGLDAPRSIADNIKLANLVSETEKQIDVLIVGRGGGAKDDLECFNDEMVAIEIFKSKIPIISAVGHESDFTIADFVADVRAETPTAAANIAVYDVEEVKDNIYRLISDMVIKLSNIEELNSEKANSYYNSMILGLRNKVVNQEKAIENAKIVLTENNPLNILGHGYAIITKEDDNIVKSVEGLTVDDIYNIVLKDGKAKAKIMSKERS